MKPRSDVYTGLLGISLLAMVVGSTLLFLDYRAYGAAKPPAAITAPGPGR
jgi:hypothetical protein